jgi:hypothetical protein
MRHTIPSSPITALALTIGLFMTSAPLGAQTLSGADVAKLSSLTAPAADHLALAAHYRAHADAHDADAAVHTALAVEARKQPLEDDAWDLARDASHYAEHSREAAEALRDLAQLHEAIAGRVETSKGGCCAKGMPPKTPEEGAPAAPAPQHDHTAR